MSPRQQQLLMAQLCAHKIAQEQQKAKRKISPREASPHKQSIQNQVFSFIM